MSGQAHKIGFAAAAGQNPVYMTKVLTLLGRDHHNFEHLLSVLTHVGDLLSKGENVNLNIVRAAAVYYKGYVAAFHHPIEDLLYGHLRLRNPSAVKHIFPVAEDHRYYGDWVLGLLRAMREYVAHKPAVRGGARSQSGESAKQARENFCLTIRGFVSHMRSHMLKEVPLFKLAIQSLHEDDWKAISQTIVEDSDPLFDTSRPRYDRLLRAVLAADESVRGRLLVKKPS